MDPERKVLSGNGKLLCLELAAHANAKVLASDAVQHYRLRLGESDVFDTGGTTMRWREDWDGNVFLFDPDTQSVSRAQG